MATRTLVLVKVPEGGFCSDLAYFNEKALRSVDILAEAVPSYQARIAAAGVEDCFRWE